MGAILIGRCMVLAAMPLLGQEAWILSLKEVGAQLLEQ
jgi:hypothetical protein